MVVEAFPSSQTPSLAAIRSRLGLGSAADGFRVLEEVNPALLLRAAFISSRHMQHSFRPQHSVWTTTAISWGPALTHTWMFLFHKDNKELFYVMKYIQFSLRTHWHVNWIRPRYCCFVKRYLICVFSLVFTWCTSDFVSAESLKQLREICSLCKELNPQVHNKRTMSDFCHLHGAENSFF